MKPGVISKHRYRALFPRGPCYCMVLLLRSYSTALSTLITGLAHIGIRVHDLERSRAFYEQFGFTLVAGPIGMEPVAILAHPSGVVINFILNAPEADAPNILMDVEEKYPGYTHIALAISDISTAQSALEMAGIALSGGPITFSDGSHSLFIRDPDRNVVELHQEPV